MVQTELVKIMKFTFHPKMGNLLVILWFYNNSLLQISYKSSLFHLGGIYFLFTLKPWNEVWLGKSMLEKDFCCI